MALCFSIIGATVSTAQSTLFSDDFNDGNANGWTTSGGTWSVNASEYLNTSSGLSTTGDSAWTDYSVEAKVKPVVSTYAGIMGRYQSNSNYYQLEVHAGNNKLSLWRNDGGSWTEVGSYSTTINTGTAYTLKLDMNGTALSGYLNGTLRISVTDSAHSSGKIGVRSGNDARFDDVIVLGAGGGVDAFSQIEAEDFDSQSGLGIYSGGTGQKIGSIENGTWARYDDVDFGAGANSFSSSAASNTSGGAIQLRLGSTTGTLIGSATVTGTGGWNNFTTVTSSVSGASGVQDLYLVFVGGSGSLLDVDHFVFSTGGGSPVVAPVMSPSGGTYSSTQSVSITSSTSGSTIRYTTNGSNPTSTTGTVYSGTISVSATTTLKAIAYKSGMTDSSVTTETYTISSGGGAPTPVASFGPNGTHWPDLIDTPFMYDYTVTNLVDVACSWSAISSAIAAVTSTQASQGVLIRVAPGTLTGNGAGSTVTPVLQNLGSSTWSKRITVAPRDGWGTVVVTGGARIFNVKSVCFAGFDVDSLAFHANHRSALAWTRIGSFLSANGYTGYTTNNLEIVEMVMPNQKVVQVDQMDSFSSGATQIDGFTMVGCYIAPCYRPSGTSHHTDSLQFEPTGGSSDHTNVLLQDCAFYASTNAAVQVNGIGSMIVDHCYLAGGSVSQTRYPIPSGGDTGGTTSCFNGHGINMEAYDSYVVGGGFTGSGQQWSYASNTRISGSTSNNPTSGAWIVDSTLSATNPTMPPEPTTTYLESIWLP